MSDKGMLEQWLDAEAAQARGFESGELDAMRTAALDRYYGRPRGDERVGRSKVQSNDIADMVEAIVAQVLPGFSGDSIVEFEPTGPDDVQQAQLESDAVNETIVEENRGYTMLQSVLRNALLLRNGWTKCYVETERRVSSDRYRGVDAVELAQLLEAQSQYETRDALRVKENDDGTVDGTIRVKVERKRLRVVAVDPVLMSWQADYGSTDVQGIRYLAERAYPTRSWLIEQGYDKNKVAAAKAADPSQNLARQARSAEGDGHIPPATTEPSMQQLAARWIHYRYDADGDGVAELHRILLLDDAPEGGRILEDEVVDFIPYAVGTGFLQPHQLDGLGVYDKLRSVEDVKTAALRQWLDNLENTNNARTALDSRRVNTSDFGSGRPGGYVRVEGPPMEAIMELRTQDVGPSALSALQYMDAVRSERSGASLDMQAANVQIAGDTAHGVERQMSAKEQMAALICRTLAETVIRETWTLAHRALRTWMDGDVTVRARGQFQRANPSEWQERERVNVKAGLSVGERSARKFALEAIIAKQEMLYASGKDGVLVTEEQYHSALMDWTRAAMVDNGERYFTDPRTPEAQEAAASKAKQAEEAQNVQLQIANTAASAEQQRQQIENLFNAWKESQRLGFDYWKETLNAELKALEAESSAVVEAGIAEGAQRSAVAASAGNE